VRRRPESPESVAARAFSSPDHSHFLLRRVVDELTAAVQFQKAGENALAASLRTFWSDARSLPAQDSATETEERLAAAELHLTFAARKCLAAREDLGTARFERFLLLMDALSESRRGTP
jgi:hypothetical protein